MRSYSYQELAKLSRYSESGTQFKIEANETGLYLKRIKQAALTESFFIDKDYDLFILDEIHVTVLESYEQDNRLSRRHAFKRSSPFHITLRLSDPATNDFIIIHDFYCALDLSRDFHIQFHRAADDSISYLPPKIIDLTKLDLLIDKEIILVNALIVKNQDHETQLNQKVDELSQQLYALAAFPSGSVKKEFMEILNELIAVVEELLFFGHQNQARRLENLKAELARFCILNIPKTDDKKEEGACVEETPKSETTVAIKKKIKSKNVKKNRQVIDPELDNYLKYYCASTESFKQRKNSFLIQVEDILKPSIDNDLKSLLELCTAELELIESLFYEESQNITLKFFAYFSIQSTLESQERCLLIANFFAENMPFFKQHMRKLSMSTYEINGFRFSGLMLAYMNNNVIYWEYMHRYGMNFADNRHVLYQGMAGNLLHSMIVSINVGPRECIEYFIPFTQRLFRYLEDDESTLMNMQCFNRAITLDTPCVRIVVTPNIN